MSEPRHSNKFLDNLVSDSVDQLDAATSQLERLLTDRSKGDSPSGMNPNSRDVLDQIRGHNIDRIRAAFDKIQQLRVKTDPDLDEVRRVRVTQGYKP